MVSRLRQMQAASPDIEVSAVVSVDGLIIASALPNKVKEDHVSAMSAAMLDGKEVTSGQVIDLYTLLLGNHILILTATDYYGNKTDQSVIFSVTATIQSLKIYVNRFFQEGKIDNAGIRDSLLAKLQQAQNAIDKGKIPLAINLLNAFINEVQAQSGKHITAEAAKILIADAKWVINRLITNTMFGVQPQANPVQIYLPVLTK
jgi:hypothetical protein